MGIFDKILRDVASKIKEDVMNKIDEKISSSSSSSSNTAPAPAASSQNVASSSDVDYSNCYNTDERYFDSIITDDKFEGYTIERSVHPKVFDPSAHEKCFPISYLFKKDGAPVLAVFVMKTNQYRSMIAFGSYTVLDDNHIKYIRFFKGMKNEESYVLNRIKENL